MNDLLLATWKRPGEIAIRAAAEKLSKTGCLADALEHGLATAELDETLLMIGKGSLPNAEGFLELDASMMRGSDQLCGAVCAVRDMVPVISLARKVMEDTPHVMLAGEQALRYGLSRGMRTSQTMTELSIKKWKDWLNDPERKISYEHAASDTITMLGWQEGRTFAASSTSGLPFKLPGRVGDSPIFGSGIYADDEVGAAGSTGNGEELWKACASFRAVEFMRHGSSPQEACEKVIRHMLRRQPKVGELPCVVFAVSKEGEFGAACSRGEFELWSSTEGRLEMHVFEALGMN